jgi:hypothetical protein
MIDYIKPDWCRLGIPSEKLKIFDFEAEKINVKGIMEVNKQRYVDEYDIISQILKLTLQVYGDNSKQYKYVKYNFDIPRPPMLDESLRNHEDRKKKMLEEEKKTLKAKENQKEQSKHLLEATIYLLDHGKTFGVDFTEENAVCEANAIAWDLEIEKIVCEIKKTGQAIPFGGDDECIDCSGWDGESRRCQCGNRRVSWEFEGNFKKPWVRAEAW